MYLMAQIKTAMVMKLMCFFCLFHASSTFQVQCGSSLSRLVPRSTPSSSIDSSGLPIDAILPDVLRTLDESSALVLEAPPGAGKTTRVPLELLLAEPTWLQGRNIVVLEPRRLAAKAAAQRMASALAEPVGKRVGYRVRFDSKVSRATRIECVTEGVLLQRLRRGGASNGLTGVGCVVLDEFHERSLDADLCLALLLDSQRRGNCQGLRVVVMSATIGDTLATRLVGKKSDSTTTDTTTTTSRTLEAASDEESNNAAEERSVAASAGVKAKEEETEACLMPEGRLLTSLGRAYPVDIKYLGRGGAPMAATSLKPRELEAQVASACLTALAAHPDGDVLCFMPGEGEVKHTVRLLQDQLRHRRSSSSAVEVLPLYGALPFQQQQLVVAPQEPLKGQRIVVSTPIAEASLTLPRVKAVVDSGLRRTPTFDSSTGLNALATKVISRASAEQRAGRAGRVAPGTCYRLWTEGEQKTRLLAESMAPMLDADLTSLALQAALWLDTAAASSPQQSRCSGKEESEEVDIGDSKNSNSGAWDDDNNYSNELVAESSQESEWVEMVDAIRSLPWVDPPPMKRLGGAIDLLTLLGALEASPMQSDDGDDNVDDGDDSLGAIGSEDDDLDSIENSDDNNDDSNANGINELDDDSDVSQPALTRWRRVTPHGRRLSSLPLHPRLAHMVTTAVDLDYDGHDIDIDIRTTSDSTTSDITTSSSSCHSSGRSLAVEACTLAALLQERDPMPCGSGTDLRRRLNALTQYKALMDPDQNRRRSSNAPTGSDGGSYNSVNSARFSAVAAAEVQLLNALKAIKPNIDSPVAGQGLALRAAAADATAAAAADTTEATEGATLGDCTGALLALAYPDRVAQRKVSGSGSGGSASGGGGKVPWKSKSSSSGSRGGAGSRFTMAVGAGAVFADPHDPLAASDWIVVAEQGGLATAASRRVHLAAPLTKAQLFLVLGGGNGQNVNGDSSRRSSISISISISSSKIDGNSRDLSSDRSFQAGSFTVREVTFVISGGDGSVRRKRTTSLLKQVLNEEPLPTPPPSDCLVALLNDVKRGPGGLRALLGPEKVDQITQLLRRMALARQACPNALQQQAAAMSGSSSDSSSGSGGIANEANEFEATPIVWPTWSFASLEASADEWLEPWLAGCNAKSRKELRNAVDFESALFYQADSDANLIPGTTKRVLDEVAPLKLTVPSGSTYGLFYREDPSLGPQVKVKLQEMFGLQTNPVVGVLGANTNNLGQSGNNGNGVSGSSSSYDDGSSSSGVSSGGKNRKKKSKNSEEDTSSSGADDGSESSSSFLACGGVPIAVELLSPGGRTVAQTTDLAYFWQHTYSSVRKELRGRYPKHPWPEDACEQIATKATNRQLRTADAQKNSGGNGDGGGSSGSDIKSSKRSKSRGQSSRRNKKKSR